MATLVLTTVGTAIGGPIGGAIGALLGQQVDGRLLGKRRQGPRLSDLAVQTSTYGSAIPKIFGRMRVAGTVIWATEIREDRHKEGGGKGRPKTTSYSYSASFAVALSGRPIRAVHRIWADGKLLRGAAGDWKSETGFRLHLGGEDQAVDPLIAAAEGAGGAPAYRGIAYAVFEELALADFGNRVPSLSFEVEADAGPVSVAGIATALSGGAVAGATRPALSGYAASGETVRGAIEALTRALPAAAVDDGARLVLSDQPGAVIAIELDELGAGGAPKRAVDRRAAGALPDEIAIAYHEPARDWQPGLQRARRSGPGRRVETIELPAALDAGAAKAIAEARLADAWGARAGGKVALPWRRPGMRPGATAAIGAERWRVRTWTLERMALKLTLAGMAPSAPLAAAASAGRAAVGPDLTHGPTVLHLLDLPPLDETLLASPRLWAAAAGPEAGWRRAALTMSLDGGASWRGLGPTAAPAVMGTVAIAPGPGGAALFDKANALEIELLNDAMWLEARDDRALAAGANLALAGDELLQFGRVEPLGGRRFRLSRLLRGRRGTEWASGAHAPGERFVLIEPAALAAVDLPLSQMGAPLRVTAQGIGDAMAVEAAATVIGRSVRPPAPVAIAARRESGGDILIAWVRRSRLGWTWADGGDAPLGEERERYRLTVTAGAGAARTVEVTQPAWTYTAAQQVGDGASGAGSVTAAVAQLGTAAASDPGATRTMTL